MRSRNMLGKTAIVLTLSSYSRTVEPNASYVSVTAYANGVAITDGTSSMITYDGGKITSCTINSSGVITIRYNSNTNTSYTQSGWMKFTYQGQTVQFDLTQKADYVSSTTNTVNSGSPRDCSNYRPYSIIVGDNYTVETGNFCLNLAYDCYVDVTVTRYDVYASGRQVETSRTTTTKTVTNYNADKTNQASYADNEYMCNPTTTPTLPYTYQTNSITTHGATYDFQVTITNVETNNRFYTFTICCTTVGYTNICKTYTRDCYEW